MNADAADRAAGLVCGWLRRHGFRVEECLEDDGKGGKLNAWIKLRRANDGSKFKGTSSSSGILYLVLGLVGFGIVNYVLMQDTVNKVVRKLA